MRHFDGELETADGRQADAFVTIDANTLTLHAGRARIGSWEFDTVDVVRTGDDRFVIDLTGDQLVFIATHGGNFARTVPGWVEAHKQKRGKGLQRRLEARKAELVQRIEQSSGRRRLGRLTRPVEHDHTWREQTLPGGIIRKVCLDCDRILVDIRDAD